MSFLRSFLHFLCGLTWGSALFVVQFVFILLVSGNMSVIDGDNLMKLGFAWPALLSVGAVVRAENNPHARINPWLMVPAILILLPAVALAIFVYFFFTGMPPGYC